MPCSICHFNGHNRLTCPLKESEQPSGETSNQRKVRIVRPLTPSVSPQELQEDIETIKREKQEALEEVDSLNTYIRYRAEAWVRMRDLVTSLEQQIVDLKKANVDCAMKMRQALAGTVFDNKSDIPDGVYLELMNKLRI